MNNRDARIQKLMDELSELLSIFACEFDDSGDDGEEIAEAVYALDEAIKSYRKRQGGH